MPTDISPEAIVMNSPFGDFSLETESIKDTVNYLVNNVRRTDRLNADIEAWVGKSPEAKQKDFHSRVYIMWAHSVMEVLKEDYGIVDIKNYHYGQSYTTPVYLDENVGGTNYKIPHRLTLFLENKKNPSERIAVSFYPYEKYDVELRFHFSDESTDFSTLWDRIENHFYTKGLLKGQKFDAKYNMLQVEEKDWSDIVIKDKMKLKLNRNAIKFLENVTLFQEKNLRASRGVLITGPPGTGKTLCCEVLCKYTDATVIYVTRDCLEHTGDISGVYKLARKLAPSLVIFEDIDTLGGVTREVGDHPLLGEFLNALSGVENNAGVVTLATTNHPENLDWALTDRPGRFDVRLDFGYPDDKTRKSIFEKYLKPFKTKKIDLTGLVRKTEGYSGAYIHEAVQTAYMLALEDSGYDDTKTTITQAFMDEAMVGLTEMREQLGKRVEGQSTKVVDELYN